jgi:hypothetical protein
LQLQFVSDPLLLLPLESFLLFALLARFFLQPALFAFAFFLLLAPAFVFFDALLPLEPFLFLFDSGCFFLLPPALCLPLLFLRFFFCVPEVKQQVLHLPHCQRLDLS